MACLQYELLRMFLLSEKWPWKIHLFLRFFFFFFVKTEKGKLLCFCETSDHNVSFYGKVNYDMMISYVFSVLLYETSLSVFPMDFLTKPVHLSGSEFLNTSISITHKLLSLPMSTILERIMSYIFVFLYVYTHTFTHTHRASFMK